MNLVKIQEISSIILICGFIRHLTKYLHVSQSLSRPLSLPGPKPRQAVQSSCFGPTQHHNLKDYLVSITKQHAQIICTCASKSDVNQRIMPIWAVLKSTATCFSLSLDIPHLRNLNKLHRFCQPECIKILVAHYSLFTCFNQRNVMDQHVVYRTLQANKDNSFMLDYDREQQNCQRTEQQQQKDGKQCNNLFLIFKCIFKVIAYQGLGLLHLLQ